MGMRYREGAEPRSLISIMKFDSACISTKSMTFNPYEKCKQNDLRPTVTSFVTC